MTPGPGGVKITLKLVKTEENLRMLHHITSSVIVLHKCAWVNSIILGRQPTYVWHSESTWLIAVERGQIGSPSKGRILLMQNKFTGLWLTPANKPIVEHFIRKATGDSNGDSKHNRSTSMWVKELSRHVWIKKGLTCTSSETGPCAASSAAGRGSPCRWGQRAVIPSGDSSLVLVGPPKTCRRVRGADQWDRRQIRADVEGTLAWHTFRVGVEELHSYTLRLQSHCQVESTVSDLVLWTRLDLKI